MTPPLELRASDADRDRTVSTLRGHAAEGRLDLAELEERLEAALAARTQAELAALTSDLPWRERRQGGPRAPELRRYLAVMALLVAIWVVTGAGYFWPVWPMLGWGLALAMSRPGGALGCRRHELAHLRPGPS